MPIGTTSFAWHTQHHLTVRSTSLPLAAQMNEVVLRTNDVATSCKRCYACGVNDVALRANGVVSVCLDC